MSGRAARTSKRAKRMVTVSVWVRCSADAAWRLESVTLPRYATDAIRVSVNEPCAAQMQLARAEQVLSALRQPSEAMSDIAYRAYRANDLDHAIQAAVAFAEREASA